MSDEREYTPPIELDGGTIEIDTTPDFEGDLEVTSRDGDHIVYLRQADQIALRDLLNRIHPLKPRQVTTVEELDALEDPDVVLVDFKQNAYQWGIGLDGSEGWQSTRDSNPITSSHLWRFAPLTALHVGGAEAERERVSARDMLGIAPDFTGGLSVDEYMDEQRGRAAE